MDDLSGDVLAAIADAFGVEGDELAAGLERLAERGYGLVALPTQEDKCPRCGGDGVAQHRPDPTDPHGCYVPPPGQPRSVSP